MKKITIITTLLVLTCCFVPTVSNVAYASEISSEEVTVNSEENGSELEKNAQKFKGVDLFKTGFDQSKMTNKEKELYNYILNYEYDRSIESNLISGETRQEFIDDARNLLLEDMQNNTGNQSLLEGRNSSHGIVSTNAVAIAVNVLFDAATFALGYGTLGALTEAVGKDAAKSVVEKVLVEQVPKKLESMGLKSIAGFMTEDTVTRVLDNFIDPGKWVAQFLDHNDSNKDNGYIELPLVSHNLP